MMSETKVVQHTPGPWHLIEAGPTNLRVHGTYGFPGVEPEQKASGVALSIGSTALSFRPRRHGSHRGEKMHYDAFTDEDRANARLIASAPNLLAACQDIYDFLRSHGYDTRIVDAAIRRATGGA